MSPSSGLTTRLRVCSSDSATGAEHHPGSRRGVATNLLGGIATTWVFSSGTTRPRRLTFS